jgi:hypothetical protein
LAPPGCALVSHFANLQSPISEFQVIRAACQPHDARPGERSNGRANVAELRFVDVQHLTRLRQQRLGIRRGVGMKDADIERAFALEFV